MPLLVGNVAEDSGVTIGMNAGAAEFEAFLMEVVAGNVSLARELWGLYPIA